MLIPWGLGLKLLILAELGTVKVLRFYPVCNLVSKPATDSHAHIDKKKNSDTWVGDTDNVLQQKAAARVIVTSLPHAVLIPTGQFEEARSSAALAGPCGITGKETHS